MVVKLANNASSTLAGAINSSVTSLSVASGDASKFPSLGAGEWFPLTVVDSAGNMEIMRVTARSGATLTVTRGQEGTTAKSFAAGSKCDIRLTAAAQVDHEHAISAIVGLVAALAAKADDSEIADLYSALGLKADASAVAAALATKASLLSDGESDNTFADTSELAYVDGTTQKRGTFLGLISSIFNGTRKIANGWFNIATFKLWNAGGTFGYTFSGSPTADRNIGLPNGPVTIPAGTLAKEWTELAPVATTSGTAFDFTSIPAGVKEIELKLKEVSVSGTNHHLIQLGSGGVPLTAGYDSQVGTLTAASGTIRDGSTAGLVLFSNATGIALTGTVRLFHMGGNLWIADHVAGGGNGQVGSAGGGFIQLSGVLDVLRYTRLLAGSNTFDGGSIILRYR